MPTANLSGSAAVTPASSLKVNLAGSEPINISVSSNMDFEIIHPVQRTEPITPLRSHRMEMFAYRLQRGIPQDVPDFDISGKSLFTAGSDGEIAFRPDRLEVVTGADYRWLADSAYYNVTDRVWYPIQSQTDYLWRTNSTYFPSLNTDYSYFVGNEYLTFPSVSFTEERSDHFWSDFRAGMDASPEYTLIMVAAFRPPSGAATTSLVSPYYGVWDSGRQPTSTGSWMEAVGDRALLKMFYDGLHLEYFGQGEIDILNADGSLKTNRPAIVTVTANSKEITMELLSKNGSRQSTTMVLADTYVLFQFEFLLGRPNGTDVASLCANMEILELDFWAHALSDTERLNTTALLNAVYGVTAS